VVKATVSAGLAGLECLSGIPGSAGGTPIQNVGAYGQEVADTLAEVVVFDRQTETVTSLAAPDCGFGYRSSRFKREDAGRFVVCEVTFALRFGPPTVVYPDVISYLEQNGISSPTLADVREAVLTIRRRKGMVLDESDIDTRSVGSFFTNPVVPTATHAGLRGPDGEPAPAFNAGPDHVKVPAAWLIEHSGFSRGYECGAVGLSSKHPLAIINRGRATARDVLSLASTIKRGVADRFGIRLTPEPVFVGFGEDEDVAYLVEKRA
jgi:UDP-N-acetylmuramate dehydrogenase